LVFYTSVIIKINGPINIRLHTNVLISSFSSQKMWTFSTIQHSEEFRIVFSPCTITNQFTLYAFSTGICNFYNFRHVGELTHFHTRILVCNLYKDSNKIWGQSCHLLRLRLWCKIRFQAPQVCIQSDIHNSCWSIEDDTLFIQILSSINKFYATVVTINQFIVYCQRIESQNPNRILVNYEIIMMADCWIKLTSHLLMFSLLLDIISLHVTNSKWYPMWNRIRRSSIMKIRKKISRVHCILRPARSRNLRATHRRSQCAV